MKLTSGHSAGATATRRAEIANGRPEKIRRSEVERTEKLAKYADELVRITEELRRTADVIEMIESEPALIGALMDSGDWRRDEITQLRRHVTDLRVRIGNR